MAMNRSATALDCHIDSLSHGEELFHDCYDCGRVACSLHAEWWQQIWLCRPCYDKRGLQIRLEYLRDAAEFQIQDMLHAHGAPAMLARLEELEQIDEQMRDVFRASLKKDFTAIESLRQGVGTMENILKRYERAE